MNIIVIGPGAGSVGEKVAVVMSIVFKNLFERGLGSDDPRFSKCTWTYLNPAEVLKHCQERDVQKAIFLAVNCTGICPEKVMPENIIVRRIVTRSFQLQEGDVALVGMLPNDFREIVNSLNYFKYPFGTAGTAESLIPFKKILDWFQPVE